MGFDYRYNPNWEMIIYHKYNIIKKFLNYISAI